MKKGRRMDWEVRRIVENRKERQKGRVTESDSEGRDSVMGNTCDLPSQLTGVGLRSSLRAPKRLLCTLGSTSVQTPLALNGLEPPQLNEILTNVVIHK